MEAIAEDAYDLAFRTLFGEKLFDMSYIVGLAVTYLALLKASGQREGNLLEIVGEGIQQQIRPIKQPIDESIAYIGSAQCAHVKKLLGVAYEQMEGEREPDLEALTLWFKTTSSSKVLNMSEAPAAIAQARAYDPRSELIIFVHGFTDNPAKDSFTNISEAYLRSGERSIVALDGSPLIRWLYLRATTYVRFMGRRLGEVLAAVVERGTDPRSVHLIGHSLGAHIAGFAGKSLLQLTGRRVGRITALDPAGPCFARVDDGLRVARADACHVDAVHTDAGVYGLAELVGHVDYFPNGGSQQPGCLPQTCSHSRSWLYFAESVLDNSAFPARRCDSWDHFKKGDCDEEISYMGQASRPGVGGRYYLQTSYLAPYGRGADGLQYREPPNLVQALASVVLG